MSHCNCVLSGVAGILTMLPLCFTALLGCSFIKTLPGCIYLPRLKTNTNAHHHHSASHPGLLGLPSSFPGSNSLVQGAINSLSPPLRS